MHCYHVHLSVFEFIIVSAQMLEIDKDLDVCFYISKSLKLLFVHGQCLNIVYKTHPEIVDAFLKQQFIPRYTSTTNIGFIFNYATAFKV